MFRLFQEDFFSSEKVFKALEPGILLASSSRLEKIRRRAETLSSLFLKGKHQEISTDLLPKDQSETKNAQEDTPGQAQEDVHPPEKIEPDLPAGRPAGTREFRPASFPSLATQEKEKEKTLRRSDGTVLIWEAFDENCR